jgi:ATP-dependent DNA helicase UvrD/PcrA
MRRQGIEYRLVGGFSFYARAEIRDALAYARLASNLRDSSGFMRVVNSPPRGIGATTLGTLQESARRSGRSLWQALEDELGANLLAARTLKALEAFHTLMLELVADRERVTMSEFFRSILDRTKMLEVLRAENTPESDSRIENLQELVNAAAEAEERGESLAQFLDHAALASDADQFDESARVTLMTLHSAKGLEFSVVFLAGLEEGLFPHKLSTDDDAGVEEERRLCYVGMTRAKDRLTVSWARSRRSFARESFEETRPSRFLSEIPTELLEPVTLSAGSAKPRLAWDNAVNSAADAERFLVARGRAPQKSSTGGLTIGAPAEKRRWKLGTQVRHPKYGLGTVIDCEGDDEDAKLTVSFPGFGTKRLIERYASLRKA